VWRIFVNGSSHTEQLIDVVVDILFLFLFVAVAVASPIMFMPSSFLPNQKNDVRTNSLNTLHTMEPSHKTLYKLEINGIVYLVEPATTIAYTYDTINPVAIGKIQWQSLTLQPQIELFDGWKDILQAKLERDGEIPTILDEAADH
jgi:hypothetical protein